MFNILNTVKHCLEATKSHNSTDSIGANLPIQQWQILNPWKKTSKAALTHKGE